VALLDASEPTASLPVPAHDGLDGCARLVTAARSVVASAVDRAQHDRRPPQRLVALLELDLADADLARAHARLWRLRGQAIDR